jgi:hypothetical protein
MKQPGESRFAGLRMNLSHDQLFDFRRPDGRQPVVDHRAAAMITALRQHATARSNFAEPPTQALGADGETLRLQAVREHRASLRTR